MYESAVDFACARMRTNEMPPQRARSTHPKPFMCLSSPHLNPIPTQSPTISASTREEKEEAAAPAVLDPEAYPGGHLAVFYGSQTGTAEVFARQIEREGEDNGFLVTVVDLEDIEDDVRGGILPAGRADGEGANRAVFLMATYGEGEPTDNAARFVALAKEKAGIRSNYNFEKELADMEESEDWAEEKKGEHGDEDGGMMAEVDPSHFCGLSYFVFALGNRQYEHFCAMGKLVDAALERTGAERVMALGIGDDDNDLEGDFEGWKDNVLWPTLKQRYVKEGAIKKGGTGGEEKLPDCPWSVEFLPSAAAQRRDALGSDKANPSTRQYFTAVDCPVTVNRELRNRDLDPGSTVHMEIDISKAGKELRYQTADNLGVLPVNEDGVVESVAKALGYDLDAVFRLSAGPGHEGKSAALFPGPCTVRECLARYCDLTMNPRRSDLKLLASYAKDSMDRTALLRMSSKEGKKEYREKIVEAHVGIADIVARLCRSIEMPLEHFIAVVPRMLPRYYTISSSSSVYPDSVHITVSVAQTQIKNGSIHKGVCSNHLAGIVAGDQTVRVFCRESSFRLPKEPSRPVLMIGPGTGIAPMRALMQERSYQRKNKSWGKQTAGKNVLYFGCKSAQQDYIYEDELKYFEQEGTLNKLRVAFSRQTEKKVYVQHLLADDAQETWDLVDKEKASIFVCGATKMGADVSETLRSIVSGCGNMSADVAKAYVDKMAAEGRFVQELWSA